jgi:3-deoxy-manno-octulosonate cytidylyltransferase (CMP-KDO synthetase)
MSSICVIPARMGSSRYPNKPLAKILGYPMIGHVAKRCALEPVFDRVVVATCDREIVDFCEASNIESVMTSSTHQRASDRVQEAVKILENREHNRYDIVMMVQGDEPMVTPRMLRLAMESMKDPEVIIVNLVSEIIDEDEFKSPNCVKTVLDRSGHALYFSREPIPSVSKYDGDFRPLKQVCIIPFRRDFLDTYSNLEPTPLEIIESVDMLRVLEHGFRVKCVHTTDGSYPVDVPSDIIRVEHHLKNNCSLVRSYLT